jgi:hypothetical protein
MTDELNALEDRVLLLEFTKMKKLAGWQRTHVTATRTTSAHKTGTVEMRVSKRGGATKYELRTATGYEALSADRSTWPREAREMQEKIEAYDKQRTVGGRLVGMLGGTAELS